MVKFLKFGIIKHRILHCIFGFAKYKNPTNTNILGGATPSLLSKRLSNQWLWNQITSVRKRLRHSIATPGPNRGHTKVLPFCTGIEKEDGVLYK